MQKTQSVIIIFLVFLVFAHQTQLHEDQASYLSKLNNQQKTFSSQIQSLHSDIVNTKSKLGSQSNLDSKIKLLESSIIGHKSKLTTISLNLVPPLNELEWTCPTLHGTSQQQLRQISNQLSSQTNKLQNTVSNLSDKETQQALQNAGAASSYSQKMKQSLNTNVNYKQPSKITTGWISNLSGNRWAVGGLTLDQISNQINEQKNEFDIIKTCSQQTPFFNGHSCISCPQNQYFDMQNKVCLTCDSFNTEQRKCITNKNFSSSNIQAAKGRMILPDGVTFQDINKDQEGACPTDKPFFSNGHCIDCKSPNSLFDYQKSECTACPPGKIYQPLKFKCLSHDYRGTNYGTAQDRLLIPQNKTLAQLQKQQQDIGQHSNLELCPPDKPFYNKNQCINCDKGLYFNTATLKCESCTSGLSYEASIHRCVKKTFYSNPANSYWTSTNPNKIKQQIQDVASQKYSSACPTSTPFYDGNQCINCPNQHYFSYDTLSCSKCSEGTIFSANLHQCLHAQGSFQTNPMKAQNLIFGGISKSQWSTKYYKNIEEHPNIADCPDDRPYFDNVACVRCPPDYPYFNLQYRLCQRCDQGTSYDKNIHQCLSEEGNIIAQTPTFQKMAAGVFI